MTETDSPIILTISILGGTGKEGAALAIRWALNGYRVIIGSRSTEKALQRVNELNTELGGDYIRGMDNIEAAKEGNIVVLSVPYSAHKATLNDVKPYLSGKILVDVTVPLKPPAVSTVYIPEGLSAAVEAQALLGEDVNVVSAFQNTSYVKLRDPDADVDCDILVCGDDSEAKGTVIRLVESIGMRGIDAGPLQNSIAVEALTSVLIYINKSHKVKSSGIRITGLS